MRLAAFFLPALLAAGPARFARLGEHQGTVEVQAAAYDSWRPAHRNLPLIERAWVRTGPGARAEIELDEGSVVRIGPESLLELSDYTRLSTGQRITLLSLDRGVAWFTGEAAAFDALQVVAPGAQVTVSKGARLRLEAGGDASQIAVIEGQIRFSSPTAELELREGQTIKVDPVGPRGRFWLLREVADHDLDTWSEGRDRALAASGSIGHLGGLKYGAADLDAHGSWIATEAFGSVWKPKAPQGWAPFRQGVWRWYREVGYTWVAAEDWGWLPYHHGRWMQVQDVGWAWVPGKAEPFRPGDVYWLAGKDFAGWGPLAPGESWTPDAMPRLLLNANTTYAAFRPGALEIDPAGYQRRPREPLELATLAEALPSPPLAASKLDPPRAVLRAGSTRVAPVLQGVTYEPPPVVSRSAPAPPPTPAAPPEPARAAHPPAPVQVILPQPERPIEVYYPAPVYTGIVVVNPPQQAAPPPPRQRPQTPPLPTPPQNSYTGVSRVPREERRPAPPEAPKPETPKPETPAPTEPQESVPRGERTQRRSQ